MHLLHTPDVHLFLLSIIKEAHNGVRAWKARGSFSLVQEEYSNPFGAAQYLHFTRNKMVPAGAGSSEANKICFDVSLTLSLILHKRTDDRANKTGE